MSLSIDQLRPYIEPLIPFIADPTVTEIMVNEGGRLVFVERFGRIEVTSVTLVPGLFAEAIRRIARACDDETDEDQPLLNARLSDGSRVSVILPPVAVDGPTMSIRKFGKRYTLPELVEAGGLTRDVAERLMNAVLERRNILISGGTSTGKTTLLNALADTIPARDRIFLIEDNAEILIRKPNLVRAESKRKTRTVDSPDHYTEAVTIRDLVAAALRFRPDRIILGEVRGAEAWDLLHALNTGHRGSMSTIHGNSAEEALVELGDHVITAGEALPRHNIMAKIARAFQVVVHIDRDQTGHRHVTEVLALHGYDQATERFQTTPLDTVGALV